jgi:periplasmic divalent cation tolerance protein
MAIDLPNAREPLALVATTVDTVEAAQELAAEAVGKRLAACAQVDAPSTSTYWWDGAVVTTTEVRVTFKTTAGRAPDLEEWIVVRHPYDVPEVLRTLVKAAGTGYQSWVRAEVR